MRLNVLQSNKWLYFALQVRHPERSEVDLLKTAWCLIRRCFRVKAKNDVPRVMTH
jgi:hypothetical protein